MVVTIQSKDRSIPSVLWSMVFHIKFHIREKGEEGVGADGRPWHGFWGSFFFYSEIFNEQMKCRAKVAKPKRFPSRPLQNKCWRTNRNLKSCFKKRRHGNLKFGIKWIWKIRTPSFAPRKKATRNWNSSNSSCFWHFQCPVRYGASEYLPFASGFASAGQPSRYRLYRW